MAAAERLEVRFGVAEDKEAILKLVSDTWEWGDYIPYVLDSWIQDDRGRLFVGTLNGSLVAMSHLTFETGGLGWMEGIRVDKRYRNMGIATRLAEEVIEYSKETGLKKLRLAVSVNNGPSLRHVSKVGFKPVSTFDILEVKAAYSGHVAATNGDPLELVNGEWPRRYAGMLCRNFRWVDLNYEALQTYANTDRLFKVKGSLVVHTSDHKNEDGKEAEIGFMEYAEDAVTQLSSLFALRLYKSLYIVLPKGTVQKPLPKGWELGEPYTVFERQL
ncbi:MAG: GNAT family N-acetyltransferase [Thermoprotei archaeon]